ncbi:16S rRNA (guanine(966)-N(2))-methyltransferase RsmD [bacterium]|nr:16S rRNA (guanine(966)-N(2))-methyltransferase RsmD [bacterium]
MRIIAGRFRGRRLQAPAGLATRPTSDRVREAIFSALDAAGRVAGARVLDAFAGTGALGLEAISRGAVSAMFLDNSAKAVFALRANIDSFSLTESVRVLQGDALSLATRGAIPGGPYSLLFLDPPYKLDKFKVRGFIESLSESGALAPDATIVWEHATGNAAEWPGGLVVAKEKRYGDTTVSIAYRGKAGEV